MVVLFNHQFKRVSGTFLLLHVIKNVGRTLGNNCNDDEEGGMISAKLKRLPRNRGNT